MGVISSCFPGNSESGDATVTALTSHRSKGLFGVFMGTSLRRHG